MWARIMYRSELDFLHLEAVRANARKPAGDKRMPNAQERFWAETGLVLGGALSLALIAAFALIQLGVV